MSDLLVSYAICQFCCEQMSNLLIFLSKMSNFWSDLLIFTELEPKLKIIYYIYCKYTFTFENG